jgi:hypothetical protein
MKLFPNKLCFLLNQWCLLIETSELLLHLLVFLQDSLEYLLSLLGVW